MNLLDIFKRNSRPQWTSDFIYILAAIGCAAGLGNFWRFPMLAFEHGGAAFILVLLIANIIIVYPLLMMETVIGQKKQISGPQAFEKLKKGTGWIQWIPVFALIFILTYYGPVLAWGIKYLIMSLTGDFLVNTATYFPREILHLTDGVTDFGSFQWGLFAALVGSYLFVLYALRKNVLSLGPVIKITAIAPFILLFIILLRGVTLPGAIEGLRSFFIPDWSALLDIRLWQAAIGQAFFSASLALGYFLVSGSHRDEKAEIPRSSAIILGGNFLVSMLAGMAVFSTLGFMAQEQGVPIAQAATGGPMLVFSVLPTAVSMMPTGVIFFAILLFLVVITLAIDSIIGTLESVVGSFHDLFHKTKYNKVLLIILLICLAGSTPFLMGSGLYLLDIMDHFIAGYVLLIVGMLETAILAYFIGPKKIRDWINETSSGFKIPRIFDYILYLVPVVLAILIGATLHKEMQEIYGGYPIVYIIWAGIIPFILIIILAFFFNRYKRKD